MLCYNIYNSPVVSGGLVSCYNQAIPSVAYLNSNTELYEYG